MLSISEIGDTATPYNPLPAEFKNGNLHGRKSDLLHRWVHRTMRSWAEIDLAALERNLGLIRNALPKEMRYVSVVKQMHTGMEFADGCPLDAK